MPTNQTSTPTSSTTTFTTITSSTTDHPLSLRPHLTRWVSRKMSRPEIQKHHHHHHQQQEQEQQQQQHQPLRTDIDSSEERVNDSYAAYCRAFTEGRTHSPSTTFQNHSTFQGGQYSFPDFNQNTGEESPRGSRVRVMDRVEGTASTPLDEGLFDFRPIGYYGFSPLQGPGVTPPPQIMTPDMYTQRLERETSLDRSVDSDLASVHRRVGRESFDQSRPQKKGQQTRGQQTREQQKKPQRKRGFLAPLRSLWLQIRSRSRS
ncbi:hypothetical protein BDV25DRAFT_160614 [Aspergillus avenaceus]|uniref:Pal1 cell morphology protein-domain-containing protein n=1 Tax=Aspergillus avenaceus TaxID=36643 RepID=A0A5N6TLV0_ASPAV|nr:hypothetical protein BDV25DRAFT_160614 [Aspergillus avenaceus]